MTTFLVEIDRFGFQTEESGKRLIDTVIWILIRRFYWNMCPTNCTTPRKPFISSNFSVVCPGGHLMSSFLQLFTEAMK